MITYEQLTILLLISGIGNCLIGMAAGILIGRLLSERKK